ncbi:LUD domain-containing protein [Actinomadura sp. NBRC 104425]|uniref:LUD domain-containing protein n=1 Tax=Actinomadura sp. NBRC 104425 TaxID=3032204 RepID=UPI002556F0C4|nr:LUD domain-containing protein [Actinomadura sp. NBRC 104425]
MPKFAAAARTALADTGLRRDLRADAAALRRRREAAAGELGDWQELREAGRAIRDETLLNLDAYLERLEKSVTEAGGAVHWAADAAEAARLVTGLVRATGQGEVVTAAVPAAREIGLHDALAEAGVTVHPTDLAELVARLGGGRRPAARPAPPAFHRDRARLRELLARLPDAPPDLPDDPAALAAAARDHLRRRLLSARVAVCGADFMVADTGTLVLLESEGNGRAAVTVPDTLICVAGIDAVVPTWSDLEVLLQLLPRSATGDRMSPAVSTWTGVTPGDGPRELHLVLLDNGRTAVLADEAGRAALRCVRCSACAHVCPVYERTGDEPYGPRGGGPIGAVVTPLVEGVESAAHASLPYASTLCGACADVCPVKIDIPGLLVHLRGAVVESRRRRPVPTPELVMMRSAAWTMGEQGRYEAALRSGARWARLLSRGGRIRRLPGLLGKWTEARDLPAPPAGGFRGWWRARPRSGGAR